MADYDGRLLEFLTEHFGERGAVRPDELTNFLESTGLPVKLTVAQLMADGLLKRQTRPRFSDISRAKKAGEEYEAPIVNYIISPKVVEFRASNSNQPGSSEERPTRRTKAASANNARDEWIYNEVCKGTPHKEIAAKLAKKPKKWERIASPQGIRQAAIRYAKQHELDRPPSRHNR